MSFKKINKKWYFLIGIILVYISLFFIDNASFSSSLDFFNKIILKILPIFVIIFILMALLNYIFEKRFFVKFLKRKGFVKWFFVILGGILSAGAIYMWYPFLAELKNKGLDYGSIACFLYNRAIKLPLVPLMILYFSLKYVFILIIVMVFASILQGIIINRLIKNEKEVKK